jgi:hypothetical protein
MHLVNRLGGSQDSEEVYLAIKFFDDGLFEFRFNDDGACLRDIDLLVDRLLIRPQDHIRTFRAHTAFVAEYLVLFIRYFLSEIGFKTLYTLAKGKKCSDAKK